MVPGVDQKRNQVARSFSVKEFEDSGFVVEVLLKPGVRDREGILVHPHEILSFTLFHY